MRSSSLSALPKTETWPEAFGFSIYGKGPTHIIKVVAGSVASSSGLKPGDQILQVNAHDVSGWSTEDIVSLVSKLPQLPPSLGVVSRLREISLTPSSVSREFGFSLIGTFPVKIHQIKSESPSDEAGLSKNDLVIKIDGDLITSLFQARRLANNGVRNGGIKLSIIPAPSALPSSISKDEIPTTSRVKEFVKRFEAPRTGQIKAQSFIEKVKEALRDRPAVVDGIVRAIKQYSDDRELEPFVFTLSAILDPPEETTVLNELRIFIPRQHKEKYDSLVQKALKEKKNELKRCRLKNFSRDAPLPPFGYRHAVVQHDCGKSGFIATIRQVQVVRRNLSFGITLRGESPVQVQSVDKGSPAEKAGLQKGDELLSLNGLDITSVPHERAVALLQGSGSMPTLVIQTTSGALGPPGNSLHQMPCHVSPTIDPKIFSTLENMSASAKPTTSSRTKTDDRDQNNNNNTIPKENEAESTVKITKLNSTWTHKYVSPDFKIHGENFDQHLYNLLMPSERRVVKRALEMYEANKNMFELLQLLNSVLDNPRKWPVWYFVVQSMKGKERGLCRRLLAEMLQSQTEGPPSPRKEEKVKENEATDSQKGPISQTSKEQPSESKAAGKTRIRRRRTMKAAYNREEDDTKQIDPTLEAVLSQNSAAEAENEESTFRVRRTRRRKTFSGIDLSRAYEIPHAPSDLLRIEEPEDKETHIPVDVSMGNAMHEIDSGYNTTGRSLRRRRRDRDHTLRRLQSAESVQTQEISLEKDALMTRNSLPAVETPIEYQTGSLRERRRRAFRRSLDGTAAMAKDPIGSYERAALVVRRKSGQAWTEQEKLPETHIDLVIEEDSSRTEETARGRRRTTGRRRNRNTVPVSSIDEVVLSENGNNNNANSLYIDEDSFDQTTTDEVTEEDSDMSLKSPLSMKGLRASFRISKNKNKDLTELKVADSNTASSNDEKPKKSKSSDEKSKKSSKPGLLERMGMGKKQQSGSESSSKDDSKSKKLFGKKSSSKKDSDNKSKSDNSNKSSNKSTPARKQAPVTSPIVDDSPTSPFPDPIEFLNNDPPTPELNNFLVRNSKKRLTFSRPPKNSDTEAFLTELSAQFDDDLGIFDDLANALQEQANSTSTNNFGAKWSYLPKGGLLGGSMEDSKLFQPVQTSDLSELNLSDIEDSKKDETPPFPLIFDSGEESGVGTMELTTPSPPHYAYRDRALEWERERENRKKRRRAAFASLADDPPSTDSTTQKLSNQNNFVSQSQPTVNTYQDDENIYQVPTAVTTTRTRTRSRRSRKQEVLNRSESVPVETSYPPSTRHNRRRIELGIDNVAPKVSENYLASLQVVQNQRTSNSSSLEQDEIFSNARRRGFRGSGMEDDMDDVFSERGVSLQNGHDVVDHPFPVDDDVPHTDVAGEVGQTGHGTNDSSRNIVYVDDENVYAAPRSERSTAVRLRNRSNEYAQTGFLQGDLSFTDINSLLKAYDDEEEDEQPPEVPPMPEDGAPPAPPPPPPPPPLAPPCPGMPPAPPTPGDTPASPTRMNVKRLNWQKINPTDLKETVWGQIGEDFDTINDVVKYLDLEQHFATKKARELKRLSLPVRSNNVAILSHKKAYNTSILLAHLKMTVSGLRGVLLSSNNQRLDSSQLKTMLLYAPDDDEATKLLIFNGDVRALNEADQFAKKMVTIPGYKLRLQALMFKQSFTDREEDIRKNLECLQNASFQLRKSKNLAKILEFVLAMGNYMNRGHNRIAKATGFKIQFLADMDSTKTSDNKLTFLHILARAVYSKFPELCSFAQDLTDVRPAAKVTYPAVFQELQEMRTEWVEIRDRMPEALTKQVRGDRFKQSMESFLVRSNGELKNLELLFANTMKEFNKTARYFGENGKTVGMQQFFTIFGEFINKFEKADREIKNIMKNKGTNMEDQL